MVGTDVHFQRRRPPEPGNSCEGLSIAWTHSGVHISNAFSQRSRRSPMGLWEGVGGLDAMLLPLPSPIDVLKGLG